MPWCLLYYSGAYMGFKHLQASPACLSQLNSFVIRSFPPFQAQLSHPHNESVYVARRLPNKLPSTNVIDAFKTFEPPSSKQATRPHHQNLTPSIIAMADDPIKEPPDQPDQLSLQTSPATAGAADQPVIATSFHAFALLPEEIRRQIWQYASISTRMHVLKFPNFCLLPPAGPLEDPTLASHYNYAGIADDLAMLISNSDNYPSTWHVPRCLKFRKFFWRCDLNRIGAVCPEAREAYLSFRQQAEHSRLKLSKGVHVNDSFDIFHFSESTILPATATFLLTMRPRLRRK